MKILYVWGDDDYGALTFEQSKYTVEQVAEMCQEADSIEIEWTEGVGEFEEYNQFNAKVYEFGEIDLKFIEFVMDKLQDYDDSKHHNFYVVKE